jgi:hypothetical protein
VDANEARVVDETLALIAHDSELFVRGGVLVHVTKAGPTRKKEGLKRRNSQPIIRPIEIGYLRTVLARNIQFAKWTGSSDKAQLVPVHVPDFVTRAIDACGSWQNPAIEAVTECPFIALSGNIVTAAGFDSETGVFLQSDIAVNVPEQCGLAAARRAADLLLDLCCDVPFALPCHRSAVLAALLTEFGKQAYDGPTPPIVIDSNVRGSGKGKLLGTIYAIQTGQRHFVSTYPNCGKEMQTVITSMAIAGDPIVVFDKLDSHLGGSHLEAAVTGTVWQGRVLGFSRMFRGTFRPTWYFTGNNVRYRGDMPRRVLPIRIVSPLENPEERAGFKYSDIVGHALEHRCQYVEAGLTILRAFIQAGTPQQPLITFASFEGWSDFIRQAVIWCGLPDPCEGSRHVARESDEKTEALRTVIDNWPLFDVEDRGVTSNILKSKANVGEETRLAWCELCDCQEDDLNPRKIGWALRRYRGRVVSGWCIDDVGQDGKSRTKLWRRIRVDSP